MKTVIKKWWRGNKGVTAVEFSLIGIPFVLMTVGIIETALMLTTNSMLQESTFAASRLIRTGQVQQAPSGAEEMFRDAVCDFSELLIPCDDIQFQVQEVPSFADAADNEPGVDEDGNFTATPFDPGVENSVVIVRVLYNYPIRTPMMQMLLSNREGGRRTMLSTVVLQTEPYQ